MARKKKENQEEPEIQKKVTDIDAALQNIQTAVEGFVSRWMPAPSFTLDTEVMGVAQLRDAMGLRYTGETGDPWPEAEMMLVSLGFCWHWIGGQRVMLLMEREGAGGTSAMPGGDDGWADAREWDD